MENWKTNNIYISISSLVASRADGRFSQTKFLSYIQANPIYNLLLSWNRLQQACRLWRSLSARISPHKIVGVLGEGRDTMPFCLGFKFTERNNSPLLFRAWIQNPGLLSGKKRPKHFHTQMHGKWERGLCLLSQPRKSHKLAHINVKESKRRSQVGSMCRGAVAWCWPRSKWPHININPLELWSHKHTEHMSPKR